MACVDFSFRVLKLILDTFLIMIFIDLLRYFVRRKSQQLDESGKKLTGFNKFIIVWTLILVSANYLHSAANLIYNSLILNYSVLKDDEGYKIFRVTFAQLYVPLADYLTVMTLLYLFYF